MPFAPALTLTLALLCAPTQTTRPGSVMVRTPDVSQHAIVFHYDGDLWMVDRDGGEARRISSGLASEGNPKFSPDGTRLAYMAGYDGGSDLYVMPVAGGVPRRVTHHPETEVLCDWHPDGEHLLFFSPQLSGEPTASRLFLVPASGGQPRVLPPAHATHGTVDAAGERLAFTPTSGELHGWTRYRGGLAPDVWIFNVATLAAQRVTTGPATDAMPMWHGDELVFLSDRELGRMNLFAFDPDTGTTRRLTSFEESDVHDPSMGPEDVVFESGGKLFRFHFGSDDVVPVEVIIPGDRPGLRTQRRSVADLVRSVCPGPEARRAVVEARGELFSVPAGEGIVTDLTRTSGIAERSPRWSPDGRWIAFFSDRSGEYELTLRRWDGRSFEGADEHGERRLTELGPGWKSELRWAPDSRRLSFATEDGALYVVELATAELTRVATSPAGEPLRHDWSPDSAWLTWSHRHSESRLGAVYLYDLTGRRAHEVTSGAYDDAEPCFDRDGGWLYFHSGRAFEADPSELHSPGARAEQRRLMAVRLTAAPAAAPETHGGASDPGGAVGPREIELEGFEDRALLLPVAPGRFEALTGIAGGLLYLRVPRAGPEPSGARLMRFDSPAPGRPAAAGSAPRGAVEVELAAGVDQLQAGADGASVAIRRTRAWSILEPRTEGAGETSVDLTGLFATIAPRSDWRQLIVDAWRLHRDLFYDPGLHGVDWDSVLHRTLVRLEDATSRGDVARLLTAMAAELWPGPPAARPGTGEPAPPDPRSAGLLGCDWALDASTFRIDRILSGGPADVELRSPLAAEGTPAREDDYLIAVNGVAVDPTSDVYAAFLGTAEVPTRITVASDALGTEDLRELVVRPLSSEGRLRYRDWVRRGREAVAQRSGGRVGYVHLPNTGPRGRAALARQFMAQMHEPALVVDARWALGGPPPRHLLELLRRPLAGFFAVRHGEDLDWPLVGHRGPKAMLVNQATSGGSEALAHGFRLAQLGKLVGTRTRGGPVAWSAGPTLVDGTEIALPRLAFYELDGTWGIEGRGVEPDVVVVDDPSVMLRGEDPQLETAVDLLLGELEAWPFVRKTRPPAPERGRPGEPGSPSDDR